MAELDTITVRGFKSIASIEDLKLAPINVIIGPNGSGKSNFIGVFAFLHAIREGHLQNYVLKAGGADKILHFGSKVTEKLYVHISFEDGVNQYEIELEPTEADGLVPVFEIGYFWDKQYPKPLPKYLSGAGKEAGISNPRASGIAWYVRNHLDRWRIYHFHDTSSSSPMKKTANIYDNRYLRPDGSNLAPFLYFLRERHPDSYGWICDTIRQIAPFFDDFQLEPLRLNPTKILLEWRHVGSEAYFDASSFSDGTLRFIALCTLFLQPDEYKPSVILVDEPELGLHPYAISMFAALVKQTSINNQVILSTQSPFLLDEFEPEDVLVADRVDGSTQFTRLESAELADMLEDYSLGQLWEKNEFTGNPTIESSHG
jgi:predicted ATPase